MENIMKNTKRFLYVIVAILSSIVTSQQYAMNTSQPDYRYGNLKVSKGVKHRQAAAEKERQAAEEAEEKRRFNKARFEASFNQNNPVLGQFIKEFNDNGMGQQSPTTKRATEQRSTETSPLPFPNAAAIQIIALKNSYNQASTPIAELTDGRASIATQRTASPFRVIIERKNGRAESPFAQFAAEGKESPFDEKNAVINTNSSTQSPMEQVAAQSLNPRTHSSTNYEETISESGSDLFREGEDDTPFSMNIEQ